MGTPVEIEKRGAVALVQLNRPEAHNAMDRGLLVALADATRALGAEEDVRAVVITGGERAFSAGGDMSSIATHPQGPAAAVHELAGKLHEAVIAIRRMPKPVIAAVTGVAAGAGMSLALACDLRVMARSARLVLAYPSRGLSPDGGASFALPRLVGLARSLEIAALDEPIPAEQALSWGLVTRLADDGRVLDEACALAADLTRRSVHAFGVTKRLFLDSFGTTLERQLDEERETLAGAAAHPDGAEGVAAFLAKRPPVFGPRDRGPASEE
jgi:2-(1,2-epoxy-1,2-dihydrophenyl)acetyl-CoA isomerase